MTGAAAAAFDRPAARAAASSAGVGTVESGPLCDTPKRAIIDAIVNPVDEALDERPRAQLLDLIGNDAIDGRAVRIAAPFPGVDAETVLRLAYLLDLRLEPAIRGHDRR